MKDENKIIQSLWIGTSLSPLEKLSLKSFMSNGHIFHLYVYDDIENIPDGVVAMDANDIVKKKDIFLGQRKKGEFKGYEAFSDFFRYKLLYDYGGWWCDLDVICLQPFDFSENYVFASHLRKRNNKVTTASGCVMKLPAKSEEARYCLDICLGIEDKKTISYSDIGPRLVNETIEKFHRQQFIRKTEVFCPIQWWEIGKLVKPNRNFQITPGMYGIHCFNVRWLEEGFDKDKRFDKYSIYEQLKSFYNITP